MVSLKENYKVETQDYFMKVLLFWYVTEVLLKTRFAPFLGIPKETLNTCQSYLVLVLLLIEIIFFQRYTKREIMSIGLFGFLLVIVTLRSHFSNELLSFTLFAVASKNADIKQVIRIIYRTLLILIPTIVILSLFGVLDNYVTYRVGGLQRYSSGFYHPNTLGQYIYTLMGCHFYLHFDRLKWWDYILALGAAVFCNVVPNSKTAVILLYLLVAVTLTYKLSQMFSKEKVFLYGLLLGAFACNAISVILSNIDLSTYPVLSLFDNVISSRFSICNHDIDVCGLTWFGQEVNVLSTEVFSKLGISQAHVVVTLDNSYIAILLKYGIVMFAIFSALFLYNMYVQIQKQRSVIVILLFLTAVYGVTERSLFMLSINIFLLSFADVFYDHREMEPCSVVPERRKVRFRIRKGIVRI